MAPLLLLLAGAFLLWYRATMHNWPWQGDPARLSICDRDYYPWDQDVAGTQMRRDGIHPHYSHRLPGQASHRGVESICAALADGRPREPESSGVASS